MKSRDLLSAIGKIDDKYVKSAEKSRNTEDKKRVFSIIRTVAAAVFAVAVIGAVWVISYKNVTSRVNAPANAAQTADGTGSVNTPGLLTAAEMYLRQSDNAIYNYAKNKNSIYSDDLRKILFCMHIGGGYAVVEDAYDKDYPDGPDGQDIGIYHFYYPAGLPLLYVNNDTDEDYHLSQAYENKLINDIELQKIYYTYSRFLYEFYPKETENDDSPVTIEIIPDDFILIFDEIEKITDKDKAAELRDIFDGYLNKGINPDLKIKICVKLSDNKYAARLDNILRVTAANRFTNYDNAGGYPILVYDYGMGVPDEKIIVVSGDDIYYGAETAYNEGVINDEEAESIFRECFMHNSSVYYRENTSLLRRSIVEFLNGGTEADKKTGTGSKITYYRYIDIPFCLKLDDEKYALLYHIEGEPTAEFISMEANIKGYKFIYRDGYELKIWNNYMIQGASSASLSDDEAARLYEVYNRYINQ